MGTMIVIVQKAVGLLTRTNERTVSAGQHKFPKSTSEDKAIHQLFVTVRFFR